MSIAIGVTTGTTNEIIMDIGDVWNAFPQTVGFQKEIIHIIAESASRRTTVAHTTILHLLQIVKKKIKKKVKKKIKKKKVKMKKRNKSRYY